MSIDCKATVLIGDLSRGGLTRGDHQACDHDLGCKEQYIPCGIVDEDTGQLRIMFGSSYKTSDFIVDALEARWDAWDAPEKAAVELLQIKMDNGSESNGVRTQFLHRMVQFADHIAKPRAPRSAYRHSKDGRDDLKQVLLSLGVSGEGGLPLRVGVRDSNRSDSTEMPEAIEECLALGLEGMRGIVADSNQWC